MNSAPPAATIASVRRARPDDLARIVHMGLTFLGSVYAGSLPDPPDPDAMARTAAGMLDADDKALFVLEVNGAVRGMLGMFLFVHPFTGARTATELFWWVDPAHRGAGLRLLKAGQQWAREVGAGSLLMIAPGDDVARFYERLGYLKVETTYVTRL